MSKSERPRGASAGAFARRLIAWHRRHGRHDLPWQREREPYRVWLSEIMLQQTQVATVLPFFARFLQRFPDVGALARARTDDVMAAWSGLGYYARARNLHACAREVVANQGGRFPASARELALLPGIGPSTAAAIAAFCFDERAAILDGNVKRVLARHWAIEGFPGQAAVARLLWARAEQELPARAHVAAYTQAIMDLGATVCTRTRPGCAGCPVRATCQAHRLGRTGVLPAPRPARARATRTVHVLVALSGRSVLLQRRGPSGIWGGLMCLPEFDSRAALQRQARALVAGDAPVWPLAQRRHALTHLTLVLKPCWMRARTPAHPPGPDGARWRPLGRVQQLGLPAPHRVLLREAVEAACAGAPAAARRRRP